MGRKFTLKCHIIHCRTRIEDSLTSARLKIVRFYARCIKDIHHECLLLFLIDQDIFNCYNVFVR